MLSFGWASREFTPQGPAMVQGQKYVRVAREARDPLTLTALAIEGEDPADAVVWISCDLTNIPGALHRAVRERLGDVLPDVPAEGVILNATHTHEGPVLAEGSYPHPGGDVMPISECREWVADRAAEAAVEAWRNRTPRLFGRAFGHAVVGHNRRAVYADGTAQMYGSTDRPDFVHIEGYEDHSLDVLAVWEPDGTLTGLAVDVPCPSQVDEHLEEWSADYWHDVRVELRRRFGDDLYVLPLCGAAGDQSPHFLLYGEQEEEMRRRRGVSEREEIARRVGQGVADALACTAPPEGHAVLAHRARRLELPGRTVTEAECEWARRQLERSTEAGEDPDLWWPTRLRQVIECYREGRPMPDLPADVHVVRLGDAVVATNPFELYLDYGLRIKARSPAAQTLIVQLAGVRHRGAYLPTERAARGGHYGAHPVSAPTAGEGGHILVEETLKMIHEVWET
ncbi:MAG: hypothetical protein R6X33_18605 [Candidatus Brocadiia bacterium]